MIYEFDGIRPVVAESAYVHPSAVLIGDVIVGPNVYIGPNASLRGDFGRIVIGRGANVQDNCVMHSFAGTEAVIEEDGHVGHGAVLHGCLVGRNAMVGMNAVVMDGAVLGENAIVGACAFVKTGFEIPANTLAAGMPARVIRTLEADEIQWKYEGTVLYQDLARRCATELIPVEPLREPEPNRRRVHWDVTAASQTLQESRRR